MSGAGTRGHSRMGMAELKALTTGNAVHAQNLANGLFLRAYYAPAFKWLTITPGKDF